MPRAPACQPNEIYEALKELRFIDKEGKLLPWNDDVWQQATDALQNKLKKDYVYLYLSRNRNDVYRRIHGTEVLDSSTESHDDTTADGSRRDPNWSMGETNCVLPPLRKTIAIPRNEWDNLKSHIVTYKGREYEVLVIGWTDIVYDALWDYLDLPCPFASENAHINRNPGEIFLTIIGHCSECASDIHIYCLNEPTDDDPVFLRVSTFDSRGVAHEHRRQVKSERRVRIGKQLQGKTVYAWRRDEANRLMKFGDVEPASLPLEEVARKLKQEALDKELGLHKVKEALASVWDMKYGAEFSGSIREIGLDKFYLLYWTPTQLCMYKKFRTENTPCRITIDASGSLVEQITNPAGAKRVVYLYQAVCSYLGKILPLFQWLAEKHDANTICYCIREWLRSGGSCPDELVTDYSLALLNAVALACNNCDLKTYIENCLIFNGNVSSIRVRRPRTVIRIDIAHLIKLVAGWDCFKHESPQKKDFYLRCVGLLTMCTEITEFTKLCTDVATMAFSSHEDIDDPESHCFAAQDRVMQRLKTYNLPVDTPENVENSDPDSLKRLNGFETETTEESTGAIDAILTQIRADSSNDLKQGRLNPYHCVAFGSRLLKLSKQFVLWTAVMALNDPENPGSLVATSARSEEYFRELKHLVLKKGKAIRLDKFLVIHLRSLEGTNKLLNAPRKESKECKSRIVQAAPGKPKAVTSSPVRPEITNTRTERMNLTHTDSLKLMKDTSVDSRGHSEEFPMVGIKNFVTSSPVRPEITNTTTEKMNPPDTDSLNVTDTSVDSRGHSEAFPMVEIEDSASDFIQNCSSPVKPPEEVADCDTTESEEKALVNVTMRVVESTVDNVGSEMAYLNEFEGWRLGHVINPPESKKIPLLQTKKRGKFLKPCPDIEIIHRRRKFTPVMPLLRIGTALPPLKIRQQTVRVRNTCAFDTTVQGLLAACHDFPEYAEYLADFNAKIFEFVQKLSATGVTATLYEERGSILSTTNKIENGVLDCTICISYLQDRYILRDVPSLVRTLRCTDCQFEVTKTLPVLHVDPISVYQRGMAGLQEALDKTCTYRSTSTCYKCKSSNITKGLSAGNHLMVNIEDVANALLAERRGYGNCRRKFTLAEIPDKLAYDGYMYCNVLLVRGKEKFSCHVTLRRFSLVLKASQGEMLN